MSTTATEPQTIVTPPVPSPPSLGFDHWVCIPATWEIYEGLLEARGERGRPKYIFLDGRLTVVSPGTPHERHKKRLGGMIEDILIGLRIKFCPTGEVTLLKSLQPRRTGAEPDESYYLTNIELARGKKDLLMGVDPAPDLVVEVVVTNPEDDAVEAYREFSVREVWVSRDETELVFLVLGSDGRYAESAQSAVLPFLRADELSFWVFRTDLVDESEWRHEFRAWVEQTLVPRHRPA